MRPFFAGIFGTLATFTLGEWNHIVGIAVGVVTLGCLIPVLIYRWKKALRGESQSPFDS